MDCSLPFVMLPNKDVVETCATIRFNVGFCVISVVAFVLIVIALLARPAKIQTSDNSTSAHRKALAKRALMLFGVFILVEVVVWFGLKSFFISSDVYSWERYQAQVNQLVQQGMSKGAALQAIQNQINTRNIESTILAQNMQNNNNGINIRL